MSVPDLQTRSSGDCQSTTESRCRSCNAEALLPFLDLGTMPLADRLVAADRADEPEPRFSLVVTFCEQCALVQINETVDPEVLFADEYPYFSSFSPALLEHARLNAEARMAERKLDGDSQVIELASNDGYLLKNYHSAGIPVLGIDPACGPVEEALKIGVDSRQAFFTSEYARQLAAEGLQADVMHANNVLAHVADLNGFVEGIATMLKPTGVMVIEAPYLVELIEHLEFDTIYHEHLCYFSVVALDALFRRHGLYLNRVERLAIHGGSLRLFVEPVEKPEPSVIDLLAAERAAGVDRFDYFRGFADRVKDLRQNLVQLIKNLQQQGRSLAAYGASAKGATLLNYCGLGSNDIEFVVDRNTYKQGKLMPGARLPIMAPEELMKRQPDDVLLLTWNFADEILAQQAAYLNAGGRFIVPVPSPRLVDRSGP